jgi:hypothetical protein
MNFISTTSNIAALYGGNREKDFIYKTEFNIDLSTETPNVYFIVFDTMTSPYVAEKYFDANVEPTVNELKDMGFFVAKDNRLFAFSWTAYAMPALLSPWYYESYLKETYESFEGRAYSASNLSEMNSIKKRGLDSIFYIATRGNAHYELNEAFFQRNYTIFNGLIKYTGYRNKSSDSIGLDETMFDIIKITTPYNDLHLTWLTSGLRRFFQREPGDITIQVQDNRTRELVLGRFEVYINKINEQGNPTMVYIHEYATHNPYNFHADGTLKTFEEKLNDSWIKAYRDQYEFCLSLLSEIAEMIISNDPNAVIIITGDHGVHGLNVHQLPSDYDYLTVEDLNNILNQVFFAVYLGGNEINEDIFHTPLNATRYLINTYVGENYEYILD